MYIKDYNTFINLYNWVTNSNIDTPVKVVEKSDFFDNSDFYIYKDKEEFNFYSINKLIGYNYLYNYIYYLQAFIKNIDNSFSLSKYNNIYELNYYSKTTPDIDLSVFIDWFLEEGVEKIVDFIDRLESNLYKNEDMYNIMSYYNYLIDDSLKNVNDTVLTFLTEGCTEVFNKLNEYVVKPVTYNDVMNSMSENRDIIEEKNVNFNSFIDNEFTMIAINNGLVPMSVCEMQTSFFI